jgi:uncharacterized protein
MNRVVHFEIHADKPADAAAWYGALFGWRTQEGFPGYFLLLTGDGPGIDGAVMQRMGPAAAKGAPVNAFVCTVSVDDIDAMIARAHGAGATEALPKMAIPGVGWVAYAKDPDGNIFGLHQADTNAK